MQGQIIGHTAMLTVKGHSLVLTAIVWIHLSFHLDIMQTSGSNINLPPFCILLHASIYSFRSLTSGQICPRHDLRFVQNIRVLPSSNEKFGASFFRIFMTLICVRYSLPICLLVITLTRKTTKYRMKNQADVGDHNWKVDN